MNAQTFAEKSQAVIQVREHRRRLKQCCRSEKTETKSCVPRRKVFLNLFFSTTNFQFYHNASLHLSACVSVRPVRTQACETFNVDTNSLCYMKCSFIGSSLGYTRVSVCILGAIAFECVNLETSFLVGRLPNIQVKV